MEICAHVLSIPYNQQIFISSSDLYLPYLLLFLFFSTHRHYYAYLVLTSLVNTVFIEEEEAVGASTDILIMSETNKNSSSPVSLLEPHKVGHLN